MNYLLDTHYLLWSMLDPKKIGKKTLKILEDTDKIKYVSKISYWEIALKYSLGKLELRGTTPEELLEETKNAGFQIFDITEDDIVSSYRLPSIASHKDPFDRLLVWQCIRNDLVLITVDGNIRGYEEFGLKLI